MEQPFSFCDFDVEPKRHDRLGIPSILESQRSVLCVFFLRIWHKTRSISCLTGLGDWRFRRGGGIGRGVLAEEEEEEETPTPPGSAIRG